jgi:hypothetical protein
VLLYHEGKRISSSFGDPAATRLARNAEIALATILFERHSPMMAWHRRYPQ